MTLQEAKDQAARKCGYKDWDSILIIDDVVVQTALELYGDAQWNAAIEEAAEVVQWIEYERNVSIQPSILKLKKP